MPRLPAMEISEEVPRAWSMLQYTLHKRMKRLRHTGKLSTDQALRNRDRSLTSAPFHLSQTDGHTLVVPFTLNIA